MDGLGSINWWGFTPALDLVHEALHEDDKNGEVTELNILIVGAGDCRHIFKTLAHSYRHPARKLHFYVMESGLELYARHMLFMNIILEPLHKLGLQDKTELFLELYGNSLVRQQSMEYVQQVSHEFVKMVTDLDYQQQKLPIIDLSHLKFKERDMLEGIFKFWRSSALDQFDICKCWELRLRQYLGVRFDAIPNVFDWDYHMKLVEKQAAIINVRNYSRWRHRGVAYELREGTYDVSNKTLASGMVFKREGERFARRGYWGDIIVSPYITFGIECEEQSFFKKSNNIYTSTSEDVAQYNVLSMMHEIAYRSRYEPASESHQSTVKEIQDNKNVSDQITACNSGCSSETRKSEDEVSIEVKQEQNVVIEAEQAPSSACNSGCSSETRKSEDEVSTEVKQEQNVVIEAEQAPSSGLLPVDFAKIHFMPLNSSSDLIKKSKYHRLFNVVYMSNSHAHLLTQDLADATFADGACIILDTAKFILELKTEQACEYVKKIVSVANSVGCQPIGEIDETSDTFVKFIYKQKTTSKS